MPARKLDTAFVEIGVDLDEVLGAKDTVERALSGLTRVADKVSLNVTDAFDDMARGIDEAANEASDDARFAFDEIQRSGENAAEAVTRDMQHSGERSEDAFEELSRVARREFDQIDRAATKTATESGAKFKAMGLVAGAALAGIGLAAAAGLGALAAMGLSSAASLEQTQVSFNALLGTAEKGQEVFKDLQKFAAVTPFEFPEIAGAAKRFLAFAKSAGFAQDDLKDFLTTVGDLSSVTGAGSEGLDRITLAIGQMASKGKTSLEELMQIGEAVPGFSAIGAIAESLGITTAEAMKKISAGEIDAVTGIQALLKGMKAFPGAAGAMEKQSQTLLGVFSTFKDTVGQALAGAFQPVIPAIKDALTNVTPILGQALTGVAPLLGKILATALPLVGNLVTAIVPILTPILDALDKTITALTPALQPLGDAIGAIVTALAPLLPIIGQVLAQAVIALVPALQELAPSLVELAPAIGEILIALIPLLPSLSQLLVLVIQLIVPFIKLIAVWDSWASKNILPHIIDAVTFAINGLVFILKPLANLLNRIDWGKTGEAIAHGFGDAFDAVGSFFSAIGTFFHDLPGNIADFIKSIPERIANTFKLAFKMALFAIGVGLALIFLSLTELPKRALALLINLPHMIFDLIMTIGPLALDALESVGTSILDWLTGLPDRVINAISLLGPRLKTFFTNAFDAAKTTVKNAIDSMVSWVAGLPNRISGFNVSVANNIVSFFKNSLNRAIDTINSGIASVDDAIPGVSIPRLPRLAHGGMAFGPAIIGEDPNTAPEVALPLNDPRAMSAMIDAFNRAGGGGGSPNWTVVVEIDGQQLQGRITKTVEERDRRASRTVTTRRSSGS